MNEYPLSAKSSKKVDSSHSQLKNSLLKKSACQNFDTKQLCKEDYQHILAGEKIFIQLYYKGNVTQTAYDQYITFMGGTLYKRLNSKVTIFLTNPDERQIGPILQRVKKTCSNCKIISILWFQQCFREKKKVAFDEFVINSKTQRIQEQESSKNQKIQLQLQQFIKNISEDVQNDFKQFFNNHPNPYFQTLNKNHNFQSEEAFISTVFELPPNKKQKQKQQNNRKKRKCSIKVEKVCEFVNQTRQSKSMGPQELKKVGQLVINIQETESEQQILAKKQDLNKNKMNHRIISSLMQKYLLNQENIKQEGDLTITIENLDNKQKNQILQIANTASKGDDKNNIKSKFYSEVFKKSKKVQIKSKKINTECDSRVSFSSRGSYYKNIPIKMPNQFKQIISEMSKQKMQQLNTILQNKTNNRLNVISNSRIVGQKIMQINKNAIQQRSISFELLNIQTYLTYINVFPSNNHQFYYLLNPKKMQEKVLYLYLSINNKNLPFLVNCRLIQEIQCYNKQLKDPNFKSPLKLEKIRFRFMNKIHFSVNKKEIMNKKIVFLQSFFDKQIIKKIIKEFGGILMSQEQYLLGKKPDLIITNKFGLPQKGVRTLKQDELWSSLMQFQGDLS